jgi:hypothetical protein
MGDGAGMMVIDEDEDDDEDKDEVEDDYDDDDDNDDNDDNEPHQLNKRNHGKQLVWAIYQGNHGTVSPYKEDIA